MSSIVASLSDIPTNSGGGLLFLYILSSICYKIADLNLSLVSLVKTWAFSVTVSTESCFSCV